MSRPSQLMLALRSLLLLATLASAQAAVDRQLDWWPFIENQTLQDGSHRSMVLMLYHRTTAADGAAYSWHLLNYVNSPDFGAFLPLYYRIGQGGQAHRMLAPLWFGGPGYQALPPLLSASWSNAAGGRSTWITPFYHRDTDADGKVVDWHAGTWFSGQGYTYALPFYYRHGDYGGVPLAYFKGPGYWTAPLAFSGSWQRDDGGRSTWITPLFHRTTRADGKVSDWHAFSFFFGEDYS